jgi:BirA family biotin operon repressor/biotin-[acetyl-CoA-carboxylase] ligase
MWRLEVHETLASTSAEAMARAAAGAPHGLAILALRQSAGKGSRGRGWTSPPGNLALSVVLRGESVARLGEWPLLVAVALGDALCGHLPDPALLSLKWPNDVLLRGRKLGGILIESQVSAHAVIEALVVGIGVNLAVAPAIPGRGTACLAEVTKPPSPQDFAATLLACLATRMAERARDGFAPIRAAWLAMAHPLGTKLVATLAGGDTLEGLFAGIAGDGALLLDTKQGKRVVNAGEIFL